MGKSEYEKKRDFRLTGEPRGDAEKHRAGNHPIFVIQKHDATTLHYDFRLEVAGQLASWAVPKGPSTDPREKRLAIRTEDHPLAYAEFEGVIPEGAYGAGPVLIWDRGRYDNITEKNGRTVPIAAAIDDGHVLVRLHGKKLQGGYALQRMKEGKKKGAGRDDEQQWLLIKTDDAAADARRNPVSSQPKSVKSGRTITQIRARARNGKGGPG